MVVSLLLNPVTLPLNIWHLWFLVVCVFALCCIPRRFATAATIALVLAVVLIAPLIFYECQYWDFWCWI